MSGTPVTSPYEVPDSGEPCRDCDGSGMVGLCMKQVEEYSDDFCVLRSGHKYVCYGSEDVAGDWTPASECRTCCVCPCGSTSNGTECRFCAVTMRPSVNPPLFDPTTHRPR